MRIAILVAICAGLLLVGCKKDKEGVKAASDVDMYDSKGQGDDDGAGKDDGSRKQVATGDMRDLLLALKRVHFPLDANTLTDGAKDGLAEAAEKLAKLPEVELHVDGHTDERGTTEYNMSLGEKRSTAVVKYLTSLGVEKERLHVRSFGEEVPMAEGGGEVVNAKNRRVDFKLFKGDVEFVLEEGELVDDQGNPIN